MTFRKLNGTERDGKLVRLCVDLVASVALRPQRRDARPRTLRRRGRKSLPESKLVGRYARLTGICKLFARAVKTSPRSFQPPAGESSSPIKCRRNFIRVSSCTNIQPCSSTRTNRHGCARKNRSSYLDSSLSLSLSLSSIVNVTRSNDKIPSLVRHILRRISRGEETGKNVTETTKMAR